MAKMGRKPKFTAEKERQLIAILRMKPTMADCAAYLELDSSTIEKHIKKKFKCTFSEFREQKMVHTRFSIVRKAIEKANAGDNTMLIFCLKNLCGWKDRYEGEEVKSGTIKIEISKEDANL